MSGRVDHVARSRALLAAVAEAMTLINEGLDDESDATRAGG